MPNQSKTASTFFDNYEKYLSIKHPEVTIASKNTDEKFLVLNIQREIFSAAAFILLLLLLVLPGLLYAILALFRKKK